MHLIMVGSKVKLIVSQVPLNKGHKGEAKSLMCVWHGTDFQNQDKEKQKEQHSGFQRGPPP
jgi:hypothetical protein